MSINSYAFEFNLKYIKIYFCFERKRKIFEYRTVVLAISSLFNSANWYLLLLIMLIFAHVRKTILKATRYRGFVSSIQTNSRRTRQCEVILLRLICSQSTLTIAAFRLWHSCYVNDMMNNYPPFFACYHSLIAHLALNVIYHFCSVLRKNFTRVLSWYMLSRCYRLNIH